MLTPTMGDRSRRSLETALETPEGKSRYTRRLFATIADRYDLITRLLSFGLDQRWKRSLIERLDVSTDSRILDVACGTGDLALMAAARGGLVTGLDVTTRMIGHARSRPFAHRVAWVVGDMAHLPVPAACFDIVTVGYGLRNASDLSGALHEICRCLRPGGLLASLDFERPESMPMRVIYLGYLTLVGSTLGLLLHGDPDTYRYIAVSLARYPGGRRASALMKEAGFAAVDQVPLLGGLMVLHLARKA